MTSVLFDSCLEKHFAGDISFPSDKFRVILVNAQYAPKPDHSSRSDVIGEVSAEGYTKGGAAVAVSITRNKTERSFDINLGGAAWSSSTIVARGAVYFKDNGHTDLDDLVAYIDFNGVVVSTNGLFSLSPSILKFQTERA